MANCFIVLGLIDGLENGLHLRRIAAASIHLVSAFISFFSRRTGLLSIDPPRRSSPPFRTWPDDDIYKHQDDRDGCSRCFLLPNEKSQPPRPPETCATQGERISVPASASPGVTAAMARSGESTSVPRTNEALSKAVLNTVARAMAGRIPIAVSGVAGRHGSARVAVGGNIPVQCDGHASAIPIANVSGVHAAAQAQNGEHQ